LSNFVVLKTSMVLDSLSGFGPRLAPIWWLMLRSSLCLKYVLHSSKMCLIVIIVPHDWHNGGSLFVIRYSWVSLVCPILALFSFFSFVVLIFGFLLHRLTVCLISFNLLFIQRNYLHYNIHIMFTSMRPRRD